MKRTTITEIIALLFIILFLYTGVNKLIEFDIFKEVIAQTTIIKPFSQWIAWLLPITECIVAILLFIPATRLKGLFASLFLMVIFTLYIILILNFSPHLPCSCGGVLETMSWQTHLAFNIVLMILALTGVYLQKGLKDGKRVRVHAD